MGCGISKPDNDEDHAPVLGPMNPIRRRIKEIRQGRTSKTMMNSNSTLSAKQLLDHDGVDDEEELLGDSPTTDHGRKSVSVNPMEIVKPVKIEVEEMMKDREIDFEFEKEKMVSPSIKTEPPLIIKIDPPPIAIKVESPPNVVKIDSLPNAIRIESPSNVVKIEPPPIEAIENYWAPGNLAIPIEKVDSIESHETVAVDSMPPLVEKNIGVESLSTLKVIETTSPKMKKKPVLVTQYTFGAVAAPAPRLLVENETEEVEHKEDHEKEEILEVEDDESVLEEGDGSEICPGSPSFREYYIASVANSRDSSVTIETDDGGKGAEKLRRKDSIASSDGENGEKKSRRKESVESVNSSEESEMTLTTVIVKKRGKRFRKVIPKGSQAAVKNLLNVKSCYYNPPCSNFHSKDREKEDKPQLLHEKENSSTVSS